MLDKHTNNANNKIISCP